MCPGDSGQDTNSDTEAAIGVIRKSWSCQIQRKSKLGESRA